jgi:hypothetical protein
MPTATVEMMEKTERMMTISPNLDWLFRAGFGIISTMLVLKMLMCALSVEHYVGGI